MNLLVIHHFFLVKLLMYSSVMKKMKEYCKKVVFLPLLREYSLVLQRLLFQHGGIGLYNMRERVQALGGTLHIHSENGFHIFVTIQK